MYAITAGETRINGQRVETFEREVVKDRAHLDVIAGTTGYKGRNHLDAGCRAYVGLDCIRGDFNFSPVVRGFTGQGSIRDEIACPWNGKISILAGGGLTITFRD